MANYPEMYNKLFQATTKAIAILQQAQVETEELYISAKPPSITVLDSTQANKGDDRK